MKIFHLYKALDQWEPSLDPPDQWECSTLPLTRPTRAGPSSASTASIWLKMLLDLKSWAAGSVIMLADCPRIIPCYLAVSTVLSVSGTQCVGREDCSIYVFAVSWPGLGQDLGGKVLYRLDHRSYSLTGAWLGAPNNSIKCCTTVTTTSQDSPGHHIDSWDCLNPRKVFKIRKNHFKKALKWPWEVKILLFA